MKTLITTIAGIVLSTALYPGIALTQEIPKTLRQEMPYGQARRLLLNAGWQAEMLSPNRQRFGAMNYLIDQLGYHEVETCSGTGLGLCRFNFTDANGQRLAIVTANNYGRRSTLYRWWIDKNLQQSRSQK